MRERERERDRERERERERERKTLCVRVREGTYLSRNVGCKSPVFLRRGRYDASIFFHFVELFCGNIRFFDRIF